MVYPLIMLMQTMSAGGMGGGVAAAVARALGAGHRHDAHALVLHALLIACVMGALFTTGALWGGPALYRAMGGTGDVLAAALAYSDVVRRRPQLLAPQHPGQRRAWYGNMLLPAGVVIGGGALTLCLSPALILAGGRCPPLGIAGPAWRSSPTTASGAWYCSPICSLDAVWYG